MPDLPIDIDSVKGFLPADEGEALYRAALASAELGPALEIGSYCGKSSIYIGLGCRERDSLLFAVDHHRGSEEHQPGELFHDPSLVSGEGFDTLPEFRRNLAAAGLSDHVVPIVAASAVAARFWRTPLGLLFIDGGHSLDAALTDYRLWSTHVCPGGLLAIHDVYTDPHRDGQAPMAVFRLATASGLFEQADRVGSLRLLRRC